MIYYKEWKIAMNKSPTQQNGWGNVVQEYFHFQGWFLLGFIPLFISRKGIE